MAKRIFLSSGEWSSELHTQMVLLAFHRLFPGRYLFSGYGGDLAAQAGMQVEQHILGRAVIGFQEAVKNIRYFSRLVRDFERKAKAGQYDACLFIDYPGLNLHLLDRAARHGIPSVYYISPQVWAWNRGRVHRIARQVKKMLVLFPFEKPIYEQAGCPVSFVGHPFVDRVTITQNRGQVFSKLGLPPGESVLTLMPGSRRQEVDRHFPVMWEAVRLLTRSRRLTVFIAKAGMIGEEIYERHIERAGGEEGVHRIMVREDADRYNAIGASDLALVTTGTSTVETMLAGTPMIAGYRLSALTYLLARRLVSIDHCAMPNLLAGRRIVPELIQTEFTPARLADNARVLLDDPEARRRMRVELSETAATLGGPGAADRIARECDAIFSGA